jgi:hypothetical protein
LAVIIFFVACHPVPPLVGSWLDCDRIVYDKKKL